MSIKRYTHSEREREGGEGDEQAQAQTHSHSVCPLAFLFVVRARHIIAKWLFHA